MSTWDTQCRPAAIAYAICDVTPALTIYWSGYSLTEQRIQSAFAGARKELARYDTYTAHWDGYRASPFNKELLTRARGILDYSEDFLLRAGVAPKLLTTGPSSDGSVDVEIEVGDKHSLLTLYPESAEAKLYQSEPNNTHESTVSLGKKPLEEWLSWLRDPRPVQGVANQDHSHSR